MLILHRNLGRNPSCFKKAFAAIRSVLKRRKFQMTPKMSRKRLCVLHGRYLSCVIRFPTTSEQR